MDEILIRVRPSMYAVAIPDSAEGAYVIVYRSSRAGCLAYMAGRAAGKSKELMSQAAELAAAELASKAEAAEAEVAGQS